MVLRGLAHMSDSYRQRVLVAEIDANAGLDDTVDIVLYDSLAQPESDIVELARLVADPRARRVVVYTWNFQPALVAAAREQGVHGYLSKSLSPKALVSALEAVNAGRIVVTDMREHAPSAPRLDWPGKLDGITDRESEVLALITQSMSNGRVAELTCLSLNMVKMYMRWCTARSRSPRAARRSSRGGARLQPRPPSHRPLARRAIGTIRRATTPRHARRSPGSASAAAC